MQKYYSIMTEIGLKKIADLALSDKKLNFFDMVYGDGNGHETIPLKSQTALVNQVGSVKPRLVSINPTARNIIEVSAVIPADVGGFILREIGIKDEVGDLIAVGNMPPTPKAILEEGICSELELIMQIAVSNSENVKIEINPNIISATKAELNAHIDDDRRHWTDIDRELFLHSDIDCGTF